MTLGSLFSGIGGFELAATWAGIKPIWSNEIDPFCCKILRKNFNHEIIEKDIREIGKHNLRSVDIITGGFPCQPFSQAGKRKGTKDDRYLWPEMLRVIRELKPSYVIGENVAGLLSMENGKTLEGILIDLENEGYQTETFTIPACAVSTWHRRKRIWIICYSKPKRLQGRKWVQKSKRFDQRCKNVPNANNKGLQRWNSTKLQKCTGQRAIGKGGTQDAPNTKETMCKRSRDTWTGRAGFADRNWWETEPNVGRVANGIPRRVDRLKGLGNAIVPQVAVELFKAINHLNSIK